MGKILDPIEEVLDLEKLGKEFPSKPIIKELLYYRYDDHAGEPAIRVVVVLDEATPESDRRGKNLLKIEYAIRTAISEAGIMEFPYFNFRKKSEIKKFGMP
jgi:hypothetical protein